MSQICPLVRLIVLEEMQHAVALASYIARGKRSGVRSELKNSCNV